MIKVLQLHKRASYEFKYIQDKYALNPTHTCFALADGTTQSFYSEKWAEIITTEFVKKPSFSEEKCIDFFTQCASIYKSIPYEFSKNPAKAVLEKAKIKNGGTATFIAVEFLNNHQIQVIACGDTNLFCVKQSKIKQAFPYTDIDTLDKNSHFLNTEKLLEGKIDTTYFQKKIINVESSDAIIIATDALSRLFLKNEGIIQEFLTITDFEQLHQFCLKYWEKHKILEEDDISAIIIEPNRSGMQEILPPTDFSFPKEEEVEFVPSSLQQFSNSQTDFFNLQDMQEIRQNFNAVANDFQQVKQQLKFHQILIMGVLGLVFTTLILLFLFRPTDRLDAIDKRISVIEAQVKELKEISEEIKTLQNASKEQKEKIEEFHSIKEEIKTEIKNVEQKNTQMQKQVTQQKKNIDILTKDIQKVENQTPKKDSVK